ncbi:hypothetical protein FRB99_006282, partial [Tulasnella sp. 403]
EIPLFYGEDGADSGEFIRAVRVASLKTGNYNDPNWKIGLVEARFDGQALEWSLKLDSGIRSNWILLEQEIAKRWPPVKPQSSPPALSIAQKSSTLWSVEPVRMDSDTTLVDAESPIHDLLLTEVSNELSNDPPARVGRIRITTIPTPGVKHKRGVWFLGPLKSSQWHAATPNIDQAVRLTLVSGERYASLVLEDDDTSDYEWMGITWCSVYVNLHRGSRGYGCFTDMLGDQFTLVSSWVDGSVSQHCVWDMDEDRWLTPVWNLGDSQFQPLQVAMHKEQLFVVPNFEDFRMNNNGAQLIRLEFLED